MMAVVDDALVTQFIEERALKGPEGKYTREGQYTFGLLKAANETTNARYDRITCGSGRMWSRTKIMVPIPVKLKEQKLGTFSDITIVL